jgi:uroporphyrin-III C-methyltransferase/precorrin-2 dehydrogenase/sirohydrochlorin ferrochelatase
MSPYMLGLRLEGRRVLVVGGGRVAQRRVPALLDAGARVTLVSPSVTPALDDLIADGRVHWETAPAPGSCRPAPTTAR